MHSVRRKGTSKGAGYRSWSSRERRPNFVRSWRSRVRTRYVPQNPFENNIWCPKGNTAHTHHIFNTHFWRTYWYCVFLGWGPWALGHALWLLSKTASPLPTHCSTLRQRRARCWQLPFSPSVTLRSFVHRLGGHERIRRGQYGQSQCGHHSGLSAQVQVGCCKIATKTTACRWYKLILKHVLSFFS